MLTHYGCSLILLLWTGLAAADKPSSDPAWVTSSQSTLPHVAFQATQRGALDPLILNSAAQWGLDPFLLKGLLLVESGLLPTITNPRSGAVGIAQFVPSGRWAVTRIRRLRDPRAAVFTTAMALDPHQAIPAAAELMAYLIAQYGRDRGLNAYNTGKPLQHTTTFLLSVIRQANRLRTAAGLWPLPAPQPRRRRPPPSTC